MAAMATRILPFSIRSSSCAAYLPTSVCISADSKKLGFLPHKKLHQPLTRASPLRGNIREMDQSSERTERLISASQGADDQPPHIQQDVNDRPNVPRHAEGKGNWSLDNGGSIQKDEVQSTESIEENSNLEDTALKGSIIAGLLLIGAVGGFGVMSYIYRDQINAFLLEFSDFIDGYGVAGYALFVAVYAGLEVLAIPAIPLTMSAGLLFGTFTGTAIVSISGAIAATAAFLIARYIARDRILKLAEGNKKFSAIDKAIGENGFRVVILLRLSPLFPFSLGNYLYGLTSVKLVPYILGSKRLRIHFMGARNNSWF